VGENSGIAWCHHTYNYWEGCQRVSPGCDHCYAEARDHRFTGGAHWGPGASRRQTSQQTRNKPFRWSRDAGAAGERHRVFCSSLSDVFDNAVPVEWRADLWNIIRGTPNLDWLVLTKRPQNIAKMLPPDWGDGYPNVALGTTVETQEEANRRLPVFLRVPAAVHFLSCEPLLEAVDLRCIPVGRADSGIMLDALTGYHSTVEMRETMPHPDGRLLWIDGTGAPAPLAAVDWVIAGGESGRGARPYLQGWPRDLLRQCREAGTAFFHKQVGSAREGWSGITGKGDDPAQWPEDIRAQEFPTFPAMAIAA
jgi:protein gp37